MPLWTKVQLQLHLRVIIHGLLQVVVLVTQDGGIVNELCMGEFPCPSNLKAVALFNL